MATYKYKSTQKVFKRLLLTASLVLPILVLAIVLTNMSQRTSFGPKAVVTNLGTEICCWDKKTSRYYLSLSYCEDFDHDGEKDESVPITKCSTEALVCCWCPNPLSTGYYVDYSWRVKSFCFGDCSIKPASYCGDQLQPGQVPCTADNLILYYKGLQFVGTPNSLLKNTNYRIFVKGGGRSTAISKIRFKVNDSTTGLCSSPVNGWCESINIKNACAFAGCTDKTRTRMFYFDYTVPAQATSLKIDTQVYCGGWSTALTKTFGVK